MAKGRKLEKGLTHKMTAQEVNGIISKFNDSDFQIQVKRDLLGPKYKLYDALGMWLGSRNYVDERTYGTIEGIARSYLDESLVPEYFGRLKARTPD